MDCNEANRAIVSTVLLYLRIVIVVTACFFVLQDVVLLLSFITTLGPPTDECLFLTADVVADGLITIQDVVALSSIIIG